MPPREAPGLGWRETIVCGLLLGSAIILLETVQQPISKVQLMDIGLFVAVSGPTWWGCGVAWAFFARFAEPRLGAARLIATTVVATAAISAVALAVDHWPAIAASAPPRDGFAGHVLWTNTFYGGLYVAAYAGWRRSVRSRRAVARLRQVREEAAALLLQSRLDSFQGVLQPQTLIHAVDALRGLYRIDAARGDALLDILVGVLRPAVGSLGAHSARLRDEIDLAIRFLQLRANTVGGVGELILADAAWTPDVAFPTRLLTPIVESLCLAGGRVGLNARWREGAFQMSVTCDGAGTAALSPSLRRRMAAVGELAGVTSRLVSEPHGLVWTLRFESRLADRALMTTTGALA